MPTRNVVLTDHQASFLDALVQSGRYQNVSEAMREGVRRLEDAEANRKALATYLDSLIAEDDKSRTPARALADVLADMETHFEEVEAQSRLDAAE